MRCLDNPDGRKRGEARQPAEIMEEESGIQSRVRDGVYRHSMQRNGQEREEWDGVPVVLSLFDLNLDFWPV